MDRFNREMTNLLDNIFDGSHFAMSHPRVFPAVNIWEDGECLYAEAELPGVDPKDVDVQVMGTTLTIRGEKKHEKEERRRDYHFVERRYGSFQRIVQLPTSVDSNKVDASFKDGVLTVTIAKRPEAKPRRITINNA